MEKVLVVLPARYGSKRLAGKPLIKLDNKSLIQWAYEGCLGSKLADKIVVATDNEEILNCVESFGGEAIMTSSQHKTGSDRVAEVAKRMPEYDIVINVQPDNPFVNGDLVDTLIRPLIENPDIDMSALRSRILDEKEIDNPSVSKVVCDKNNFALYYSRHAIPYDRDDLGTSYYRNKGVYGFRRDFLLKYVNLPQGELEKAESLEQLRALENGYKIYVSETDIKTLEVNTPEDVGVVEEELKKMILESREIPEK